MRHEFPQYTYYCLRDNNSVLLFKIENISNGKSVQQSHVCFVCVSHQFHHIFCLFCDCLAQKFVMLNFNASNNIQQFTHLHIHERFDDAQKYTFQHGHLSFAWLVKTNWSLLFIICLFVLFSSVQINFLFFLLYFAVCTHHFDACIVVLGKQQNSKSNNKDNTTKSYKLNSYFSLKIVSQYV